MGLNWPKNGPTGPFLAILGPFWAFSGHLGLLDVILDQSAAEGPATRIIVPPNVEILALLASFRAILAVFWAVLAPLGPFWDLLGHFCTLLGPLWCLGLVVSPPC